MSRLKGQSPVEEIKRSS